MSAYQTDTIETLYDELKQIEADIIASGQNMRVLGDKEANAAANYEGRKNAFLIELYAEEAEKGIKRTEAARVALYRNAYKQERLEKNLAANEFKAEKDYLSALQSALMSRQSRLRVLESERNFKRD